jgi:hypothetical protein
MSEVPFRVGFGEVEITPTESVPLAGYYYPRMSTGVHDPLHVRAMAVSDGQTRIVLCVADVIGLNADTIAATRQLVAEEAGLPGECLILAAMHTHTGPIIRDGGPYVDGLPTKFAAAITQALKSLAPSDVRVGRATVPNIAWCRRYRMKDGTVRTNPGILNPDVEARIGDADPAIMALLASVNGEPRAALMNFALHNDTVGGTEISADWTHYARETIQAGMTPDLPVITPVGCAGDVNHWNVFEEVGLRGFGETERLGVAIGRGALEALGHAKPVASGVVAAARAILEINLRYPTDGELAEAREVMAKEPDQGVDFTMDRVEAARRVRVAEMGRTATAEITALAFGDVALVGVPCELFSDLGREIKARSPFAHTIIITLADGCHGYIGSRKAMEEGGYEMTSSIVAPGTGECLVDKAVELLNSLGGGESSE